MMEAFESRIGSAVGEDCELAVRLYTLAAQLCALRAQSEWVYRQCFPQTAQGEGLERHAMMRGLERKKAAKATGTVRFTAAESSNLHRLVSRGAVCLTQSQVRFVTTADTVLLAGEMWVDVPVEALEAGSAGNVGAGTITKMEVAPWGIAACTNPEPCSGGMEEEDDEGLRQRVLASFRSLPNGANAAYYRQLIMADSEVAQAVVVPRPRGVGSVDVIVSSRAGVPDSELLERLTRVLVEQREIAVDTRVLAAEAVEVSVSAQVAVKAGYDSQTVLDRVKAALTAWFTGERLGEDVLLAKLGSVIYGCEGVANYTLVSPAADVTMAQGELPVLSELTVEEML